MKTKHPTYFEVVLSANFMTLRSEDAENVENKNMSITPAILKFTEVSDV